MFIIAIIYIMYYILNQLGTCIILSYKLFLFKILKRLIHPKGQNRVMLDFSDSAKYF